MKFGRKTLMTLTAPTCAGKSHLAEALISAGCARLVSTTDRAPRAGEIQGVHYDFISTEKSAEMEVAGEFIELNTFLGHRYGITNKTFWSAMAGENAPLVIVDPNGLEQYESKGRELGFDVFSVYVHTATSVRVDRLVARTKADIREDQAEGADRLEARLRALVERSRNIHTEDKWCSAGGWDVVVPGTDVSVALDAIRTAVAKKVERFK